MFHFEKILPLLEEFFLPKSHDEEGRFRGLVWIFPANDEASGEENLRKLL